MTLKIIIAAVLGVAVLGSSAGLLREYRLRQAAALKPAATIFDTDRAVEEHQPEGLVGVDIDTQATANPDSIIVNDHVLFLEEKAMLEAKYGTIAPGHYWYDTKSGLYGRWYGDPLGFIAAGYHFGTMPSTASGEGLTNEVFINGREISGTEVTLLTQYLGPVPPGSYWLDAEGNYGITGNNQPLGNLATIVRASGAGQGGDNFWSTRFSAGNYNADNTQGYVSVPGVGPVDYGF